MEIASTAGLSASIQVIHQNTAQQKASVCFRSIDFTKLSDEIENNLRAFFHSNNSIVNFQHEGCPRVACGIRTSLGRTSSIPFLLFVGLCYRSALI